jgi:multidrug efflux system membrane fusion protein
MEKVRLVESSLAARQGPTAPMRLRVDHGGQVVEVLAQPGEAVQSGQAVLRLVRFDRVLATVNLPTGEIVRKAPTAARVVAAGYEKHPLRGEIIAQTVVNPRLQGQTFIIRIQADGVPLRPGMSVRAYLTSPGSPQKGVVIPRSAIVWVGGRPWAYIEVGKGRFNRREVELDHPTENGWFVSSGFSAGERVVVTGAQTLLSEEFKSQIQASD